LLMRQEPAESRDRDAEAFLSKHRDGTVNRPGTFELLLGWMHLWAVKDKATYAMHFDALLHLLWNFLGGQDAAQCRAILSQPDDLTPDSFNLLRSYVCHLFRTDSSMDKSHTVSMRQQLVEVFVWLLHNWENVEQ